jgi:predicted nucleotide-binding protein (sugar kinase/HSP70/actin superfamily)
LTADQALVAIKLAMVPYYIQKADAELQLAAAETANLPIQTALVNLGYGRLEVEVVKEYVDHLLRVAEENKKLVDANLVTAEEANRLIRTQNEETLAAYRNQIQAELLAKKLTLDEEEVLYGLQTPLARETIRVNNEVGLENYDRTLLTEKLTSLLTNLQARAQSEAAQIAASVVQRFNRETTSLVEKTIQAGSFVVA